MVTIFETLYKLLDYIAYLFGFKGEDLFNIIQVVGIGFVVYLLYKLIAPHVFGSAMAK